MTLAEIISVVVFPALGWLYGRFSRLESADARLSEAIENLNKTCAQIWAEMKTFREFDKRIYLLEQRAKYDKTSSKN